MKTLMWALLAAFLIAGCSQPLPLGTAGKTSLTVKAGAAGVRTLLPNLGTYNLTLTSANHATITPSPSGTGIFTVTDIPDGTWTANIDALVGGNIVASGSAMVSLSPGDTESLEVPLVYANNAVKSGTGGIQLKIVTTASPYPVAAAQVTISDPMGSSSTPASTFSNADSSLSLNLTNLASGSWTLNVVFFSDSQKSQPTARIHQQILVVKGASAYPDLVLQADDFSAPGKVELVAIDGGSFTYGAAQTTVSPYWIGKYPVTQAQFQAVMGFNPSYFDNRDNGVHANEEAAWSPVESLTMWDAMEYTNRLSLAEGLEPVYTLTSVTKAGNSITLADVSTDLTKNGYRLPTDAEWEFAARASNTTNDPFGGNSGYDYAWVQENSSGRPHGVGQKLPNAWGLYDTFGNVWQISNDWLDAIPAGPLLDYAGPAAVVGGPYSKVIRGGSYQNGWPAALCYGLQQRQSLGAISYVDAGFRIARNQAPRVPNLNFENLTLGDLGGQDGWMVRLYNAGGSLLPYSATRLSVANFGSGTNQTKGLTLESDYAEATRALPFAIDLNDPDATYVLTWETQKNNLGTEVGIGADLDDDGGIDSFNTVTEHAMSVTLRQDLQLVTLRMPDGTTDSTDISATPDGTSPPSWIRVELSIHQHTVSVRWLNLTNGTWSTLLYPSFTTDSSNTRANPVLWNKLFLYIKGGTAEGARIDNVSFVKLHQSQTTVRFDTNGGSPIAPMIVPLGGRLALPPAPVKGGLTFQGWYRDAALTDPWDPNYSTVTSDLVLHARWIFAFAKRTTSAHGWWVSVASSADGTHLAAVETNTSHDIWTSSDSGITWQNRTNGTLNPVQNWHRIVSSADGTHLVAAASNNSSDGLLWTSNDSGANWTPRNSGHRWVDVATSADGMHLIASEVNSSLWTSTDYGVTWVNRTAPLGLDGQGWNAVASNSNGSFLVAGVGNGSVYTSSDYGATWTQQTFLGSSFNSLASNASGQFLAQTGGGKLAVSADYGFTWTTFNDNAKSYGPIVISDDGSVMTVPETVSGDIFTSSDYGMTWINRTTGTAASSYSGGSPFAWGGIAASSDGLTLVAGAGDGTGGGGDLWTGVLP